MTTDALDARLPSFTDGDRWTDMVLGLHAVCDRVAALARISRTDGAVAPADPLADFFLGVISVGLTLRAVVGCAPPVAAPAPAPVPAAPASASRPGTGLLR